MTTYSPDDVIISQCQNATWMMSTMNIQLTRP